MKFIFYDNTLAKIVSRKDFDLQSPSGEESRSILQNPILLILFISLFAHKSLANPFRMIFGPKDARGQVELSHRSDTMALSEKTQSGEDRFKTFNGRFNVSFYKGRETSWFLTGKSEQTDTGREQFLVGDNNIAVGGTLTSQSLGFGIKQDYYDESVLFASVEFGSASDDLFKNSVDSTISANFIYAFSPGLDSQWLLLFNYSNNRAFLNNVPLPAIAYVMRFSKQFSITMGIPFLFVNYFDFPKTLFNVFLSPSAGGYDLGLGLLGPLQVFNNFTYRIKTFMHANRTQRDYRLFTEEKTVELGLRSPVARWLSLSFSSGLAFDRFTYEGEGLFQHLGSRHRIANDVFVRSKLTLRF